MRALLGLLLAVAATNALADHHCRFTADRKLDVDPAGLQALVFDLSSSDLHVQGVPGQKAIEVHGRACASEESKLSDLGIEQSRHGDRVTITPHQSQHQQNWGLFGENYAYIDVEVRMPQNLAVEVQTRSGDADISGIASLDFTGHSGDLILHDVRGDVGVEVHSGDVTADNIGSLTVRRAGSGDIKARDVHGDVKVGNVGSGDLGFTDVDKGVQVDSVGSGDVVVSRARGSVLVGSIGSGDVTVNGVGGDFTVHSAGSGDIHHRDVKGQVSVPKRHEYD